MPASRHDWWSHQRQSFRCDWPEILWVVCPSAPWKGLSCSAAWTPPTTRSMSCYHWPGNTRGHQDNVTPRKKTRHFEEYLLLLRMPPRIETSIRSSITSLGSMYKSSTFSTSNTCKTEWQSKFLVWQRKKFTIKSTFCRFRASNVEARIKIEPKGIVAIYSVIIVGARGVEKDVGGADVASEEPSTLLHVTI